MAAVATALACTAPDATPPAGQAVAFAATLGSVTIEPRTPVIAMHPCSRCHAAQGEASPPAPLRAPNTTERKLGEMHDTVRLEHGPRTQWCYDCHTADAIDQLHLPNGTRVSFDEGYVLCGACHGDKLRDFKANIHGLTTGYWNGDRLQRSCTACHDPHAPKFAAMKPLPPPARPRGVPATTPHPESRHE